MRVGNQASPKRVMSFKASENVRAWLIGKASEGYRSVGAQITLLIERAMLDEERKGARDDEDA